MKIDYNARRYNGNGYHMVYPFTNGIMKGPFNKMLFADLVDYSFEDRLYKGFKDADHYLSITYGNYMVLPPESDRRGKHVIIAYWK